MHPFWGNICKILVKMYPIFATSKSNSLTRYQKILWICSFGCKSLSNFACFTLKFHNYYQTNVHISTNPNNQAVTIRSNFYFLNVFVLYIHTTKFHSRKKFRYHIQNDLLSCTLKEPFKRHFEGTSSKTHLWKDFLSSVNHT